MLVEAPRFVSANALAGRTAPETHSKLRTSLVLRGVAWTAEERTDQCQLRISMAQKSLRCGLVRTALPRDARWARRRPSQFRPWLDPLSDPLELVYYDHRGNGRSGRPPIDTLTHEQLCADADALRAHLCVEQVVIMGHSYGGCLALEYALQYPTRVSHLSLIGTTAAWDYLDQLGGEFERRAVGPEVVSALIQLPTTDAKVGRNLAAQARLSFHPSNVHLVSVMFADTVWSAAANVRSRLLGAMFNIVDRLKAIAAPTLILVGRDDFYCPPTQAECMRQRLPRASVVVFERSGHYPFAEEQTRFAAPSATGSPTESPPCSHRRSSRIGKAHPHRKLSPKRPLSLRCTTTVSG
jgi:proline iminopeptidase